MIKYFFSIFFSLPLLGFTSSPVFAQGAAAEMYGVREIVIDYARFNDPKVADSCGLSREKIASALANDFTGSNVPVVAAIDAKPPSIGIARIQLVPEVFSHTDENFDCVSSVSLTAQSRANVVVPPVTTLRGVTVVYWKQQTMVASAQTTHMEKIGEALNKMVAQFTQQYRLDQPPEIPQ
jgi:hypothetical protein